MSKTNSLHYDLCVEGAKWLHRNKHDYKKCQSKICHKPEFCKVCHRYHYVAVELCTVDTENTDVWGLSSWDTAIIEVKVSHADFLADKKKWWRTDEAGDYGCQAGNYRLYLCPEGIIKPEELPDNWGLLYWDGKKVYPVVAPQQFKNTGMADMKILASILRRENFPQKIYNYRSEPSTIQPKTINGIPEKKFYKQQKDTTNEQNIYRLD